MSWPLLILHLSDLHFGPHGRFNGEDMNALAQRLLQALDEARSGLKWEERVGLCLVTGDIAEAAKKPEYEQARQFFEALANGLELDRSRVLFTPGNHDVSWYLTRRIELDQQEEGFDEAELERRIQERKFEHFEEFLGRFYGQERGSLPGVLSLGHGAYVHDLPHEQLSVAVLNSCEREYHRKESQGGFLSPEQAQALMEKWYHGEARSRIKIIAIHHNPEATVAQNVWPWVKKAQEQAQAGKGDNTLDWLRHFIADAMGFEGQEHLRKVAEDCRVQLILHGHHHADKRIEWPWRGRGRTPILSTGSWGLSSDKLPAEQPNMLHLIRLDPAQKTLRSVLRIFDARVRAQGHIQQGHFTLDPSNPGGTEHDLIPPEGFKLEQVPLPRTQDPAVARKVEAFLLEYQKRVKGYYDPWELGGVGVVQSGGPRNPDTALLDDMYLPLRLAKGFDRDRFNVGQVLTPEALLGRKSPLVIRGAAGSGKTTWMRWTFRRLVGMKSVIPFMLELRKLAHVWQERKAHGEERTIDAYLRAWVAESGTQCWQEALPLVLEAEEGPRPMLLVDGWDELGELGKELRGKLKGFLEAYPRVLAVVSSRPYGQGQPSSSDGFEVLDLQPLSDEEILRLAGQFHRRVHGQDEKAARDSTQRLQQQLKASPEALDLARTPLLLTMMLLISRSSHLPDKRHRLYEECLRNLLSAHPEHREREGAQLQVYHWRPDDSEERLRVVADLAARVQQEGYEQEQRAPIVRSQKELEAMLPQSWKPKERSGFLAWLAEAAGVLIDQADGTLCFTHLSFQEYLTAYYLKASTEGTEARRELCWQRMRDHDWWETLRLWAAIVWDENPGHLEPLLVELAQDGEPAGYWLVGDILADGLGKESFDTWRNKLSQRFHVDEIDWAMMSARAWAASQQGERRRAIAITLQSVSTEQTWLQVELSDSWQKEAQLKTRRIDTTRLDKLIEEAAMGQGVASARVLWGSHPLWPGELSRLNLLRLFPTPRSLMGARLQTLLSLRLTGDDFQLCARRMLSTRSVLSNTESALTRGLAREWKRYLMRYWTRDSAQEWAWYLAQDLVQDLAQDLVQEWARDLAQEWARDLARAWVHYWARDLAREWTREWAREWMRDLAQEWAREWARNLARDLARKWRLKSIPTWLVDFAAVELISVGRVGSRAMLASGPALADPCYRILQAACCESLHPKTYHSTLQDVLRYHSSRQDPFWSALARHIARCSTAEDRALLTDLAQHPEKREPPFSDWLKYYVRGDLVREDGTEVTLDELCDQFGLPRLPYLEDIPPALEVDWDAK